jgi:hypothetical protein
MFYKYYPGRDWEDDKSLENGNYENICIICKRPFIGYKRRMICFECRTNEVLDKAVYE